MRPYQMGKSHCYSCLMSARGGCKPPSHSLYILRRISELTHPVDAHYLKKSVGGVVDLLDFRFSLRRKRLFSTLGDYGLAVYAAQYLYCQYKP